MSDTLLELCDGLVPSDSADLQNITFGINSVVDFWEKQYFDYLDQGGSKIKFITGKQGSGKTHFQRYFLHRASINNFLTVYLSADKIAFYDVRQIYIEIIKRLSLPDLIAAASNQVIVQMGYNASDIPANHTFADYLSSIGEFDALNKKALRATLNDLFLKNPYMDNNFSIAISFLVGDYLGLPLLEYGNKEIILQWLHGASDIKVATLRKVGLLSTKITKLNGRHMIRSLGELIHFAGYKGLVISIDNLDALVSNSSLNYVNYTKMRRDDSYESIRELIDETDTLKHIMFVFSFNSILIDNERYGLKTYQALWMRIQNEISTPKLNKFVDILDLDKMMRKQYSEETVRNMAYHFAKFAEVPPISSEKINSLFTRLEFAKISLPKQLWQLTLGGNEND